MFAKTCPVSILLLFNDFKPMKKLSNLILTSLICLLTISITNAQNKPEKEEIFEIVRTPPRPKGGMPGFLRSFCRQLHYPKQIRNAGIEGTVIIQFVVDHGGTLQNFKVVQSLHPLCDQEVIRALKKAPKWHPGCHRCPRIKLVRRLAVKFRIKNIFHEGIRCSYQPH